MAAITRIILVLSSLFILGCSSRYPYIETAPSYPLQGEVPYHIGPGDVLQLIVFQEPELSLSVIVRPDGYIALPMIQELSVAGQTVHEVSNLITDAYKKYIKKPYVTVMVVQFSGVDKDHIKVVGEAVSPKALPYRAGLTLLDLMISVGGLTEFAAGNRAKLIRQYDTPIKTIYTARLTDLLKQGDITANAPVFPGDVLIIPEAWF